jgi:hypothetical protein
MGVLAMSLCPWFSATVGGRRLGTANRRGQPRRARTVWGICSATLLLVGALTPGTRAAIILPATFTVTSIGDSGVGSLREAINSANSHSEAFGADTIRFNISGTGAHTVALASELPEITDSVVIDGTTQAGFSGEPLIELDGESAGATANGLRITAGGCTVRGLVINRFQGHGILLQTNGGNVVAGNYIGLDLTGTQDLGNGGSGVEISSDNNRVGGTTVADRNVISGNDFEGVSIDGSISDSATGNVIEGNFLGTDKAGFVAIGNLEGVFVNPFGDNTTIGGPTFTPVSPPANLISGNADDGALILGPGCTVQGNLIGTNLATTAALPNLNKGIHIDTSNCLVGGTNPMARNVISGNAMSGVEITGPDSTGNRVEGNFIGSDLAGVGALSNGLDGVRIVDASDSTVGGTAASAGNLIIWNHRNGVSIERQFGPATGNSVLGNLIGTAGYTAAPNEGAGVSISGASQCTVGGTAPGARNVISGNGASGVLIMGPTAESNAVVGNYIGLNLDGTGAVGNSGLGVQIESALNTVGGTDPGSANVISGNAGGVSLLGSAAASNEIVGNLIGTNAAGTSALANISHGVFIQGSPGAVVGGSSPAARNVISANLFGVLISGGTTGARVLGNFIGTDITGSVALSGASVGVRIEDSTDNQIGGPGPGEGNLISGNVNGVQIRPGTASHNLIMGNRIGTDASGAGALSQGNARSHLHDDGDDEVGRGGGPGGIRCDEHTQSGTGAEGVRVLRLGVRVVEGVASIDLRGESRPNAVDHNFHRGGAARAQSVGCDRDTDNGA